MILGYGGNVIMYGGHAFTPVDKAPVPYSILNVSNGSTSVMSAYSYDSAGNFIGSSQVNPGADRDMSIPTNGSFLVSSERSTGMHVEFADTGVSATGSGWIYSPIGNYMSGIVTGSSSKARGWSAENLFVMSAHSEGSSTAYGTTGDNSILSLSARTGYYPSSVLSAQTQYLSGIVASGLYGKYTARTRWTSIRSGTMLSSTSYLGFRGNGGTALISTRFITGMGKKSASSDWGSAANFVSGISSRMTYPITAMKFDRSCDAVFSIVSDIQVSAYYI